MEGEKSLVFYMQCGCSAGRAGSEAEFQLICLIYFMFSPNTLVGFRKFHKILRDSQSVHFQNSGTNKKSRTSRINCVELWRQTTTYTLGLALEIETVHCTLMLHPTACVIASLLVSDEDAYGRARTTFLVPK